VKSTDADNLHLPSSRRVAIVLRAVTSAAVALVHGALTCCTPYPVKAPTDTNAAALTSPTIDAPAQANVQEPRVTELLLVGLRGASFASDPTTAGACWRSQELSTVALYREEATFRVEWLPLLWVPTSTGALVYSELAPYLSGREAVQMGRTPAEVQSWPSCVLPQQSDDAAFGEPASDEPDRENEAEELVTERVLFASSAVACIERSVCHDVELGCGGGGPSCTYEHRIQTSAGDAVEHTLSARYEAGVTADLRARWRRWADEEELTLESDEPEEDDIVCLRWAEGPQETLVYREALVLNSNVVEFPLQPAAHDWSPFTPRGQLSGLSGSYPNVAQSAVSDSESMALLLERNATRLILNGALREHSASKAIVMAQQADGALARDWFAKFLRWRDALSRVSPQPHLPTR
jgi:hypothetical protein